MDHLNAFVALSERLTGYSATELRGTGAVEPYLSTLCRAVPEPVLTELFKAASETTSDDALASAVLTSAAFGPVAQNIIIMWYCGTWQKLDDAWLRAHGAASVDTHVVSANAYLSGLQWKVARAHAPGGNMQGFGAWAHLPEGDAP